MSASPIDSVELENSEIKKELLEAMAYSRFPIDDERKIGFLVKGLKFLALKMAFLAVEHREDKDRLSEEQIAGYRGLSLVFRKVAQEICSVCQVDENAIKAEFLKEEFDDSAVRRDAREGADDVKKEWINGKIRLMNNSTCDSVTSMFQAVFAHFFRNKAHDAEDGVCADLMLLPEVLDFYKERRDINLVKNDGEVRVAVEPSPTMSKIFRRVLAKIEQEAKLADDHAVGGGGAGAAADATPSAREVSSAEIEQLLQDVGLGPERLA